MRELRELVQFTEYLWTRNSLDAPLLIENCENYENYKNFEKIELILWSEISLKILKNFTIFEIFNKKRRIFYGQKIFANIEHKTANHDFFLASRRILFNVCRRNAVTFYKLINFNKTGCFAKKCQTGFCKKTCQGHQELQEKCRLINALWKARVLSNKRINKMFFKRAQMPSYSSINSNLNWYHSKISTKLYQIQEEEI